MLRDLPFVGFILTTDVDRARHFYVDQLGLPVVEEGPFALVVRAGPTLVRITPVEELPPRPGTVAGWLVEDIEAAASALAEVGVTVNRYDGMDQDDRGIWTAPGGARILWVSDPDGNTLSLTEDAP